MPDRPLTAGRPPASDLAHWLSADEFADLGARVQALPDDLDHADPDDLAELERRFGLTRDQLWPERRGRLRVALGTVVRARRRDPSWRDAASGVMRTVRRHDRPAR